MCGGREPAPAGHPVRCGMRACPPAIAIVSTRPWGSAQTMALLVRLQRTGGAGGRTNGHQTQQSLWFVVSSDIFVLLPPCPFHAFRLPALWADGPEGTVQEVADWRFSGGGGGGHASPPKLGGRGSWKRTPLTRTNITIGTKGARRKILSTMVNINRVMHACLPHVTRMIQCMVLIRQQVYSSPCYLSSHSPRVRARVRVG